MVVMVVVMMIIVQMTRLVFMCFCFSSLAGLGTEAMVLTVFGMVVGYFVRIGGQMWSATFPVRASLNRPVVSDKPN